MTFRLCGSSFRVCDCDNTQAQPCVAQLVGDYLDTLRDGMLTNRAEGGPGDEMAIANTERHLWVTMRGFPTLAECEQWSIAHGCGGFIQLER
jgi:hypothetical protein